MDPNFISDVGVDVTGTASAMGTAVGVGIFVVIGLMFSFMVIRRVIRWARGIG